MSAVSGVVKLPEVGVPLRTPGDAVVGSVPLRTLTLHSNPTKGWGRHA